MEEFLNQWYSQTNVPVLSALILGLWTAVSPCPMATNITAVGYVAKNIGSKKKVFYSGIVYTLGRIAAYTLLAIFIYYTAESLNFSNYFRKYGEKILAPLLIIIGLFMLELIPINLPSLGLATKIQEKKAFRGFDMFLLGFVFALAFCPFSGVLYFGMLIPLTLSEQGSLWLPIVFAGATGLPVLIFAWLIAFAFSKVGKAYSKLQSFEKYFRKIIAVLFIVVGAYLAYEVYF